MDDWTRMYVGDEIAQAGYQGSVVLGEAVSGAASVAGPISTLGSG